DVSNADAEKMVESLQEKEVEGKMIGEVTETDKGHVTVFYPIEGGLFMFRDIAVEDLMNQQQDTPNTIIDVRSPKEFNEATIPGSVNIPVFSNEEREEVGTIYKQVGQEAAKEKGLEIFSNNLSEYIAAFIALDTTKPVFCWRGGMRSRTAATVLDLMGVEVARLSRGIRASRNWVMEQLENLDFPPDLSVLNGCTG